MGGGAGRVRAARRARRGRGRAVFSGAASVLRPASLARDVRTVGGDWRDDWLLVRVRGFAQCPNQISAHGQRGRVVVEK